METKDDCILSFRQRLPFQNISAGLDLLEFHQWNSGYYERSTGPGLPVGFTSPCRLAQMDVYKEAPLLTSKRYTFAFSYGGGSGVWLDFKMDTVYIDLGLHKRNRADLSSPRKGC